MVKPHFVFGCITQRLTCLVWVVMLILPSEACQSSHFRSIRAVSTLYDTLVLCQNPLIENPVRISLIEFDVLIPYEDYKKGFELSEGDTTSLLPESLINITYTPKAGVDTITVDDKIDSPARLYRFIQLSTHYSSVRFMDKQGCCLDTVICLYQGSEFNYRTTFSYRGKTIFSF